MLRTIGTHAAVELRETRRQGGLTGAAVMIYGNRRGCWRRVFCGDCARTAV